MKPANVDAGERAVQAYRLRCDFDESGWAAASSSISKTAAADAIFRGAAAVRPVDLAAGNI